MKLISMIAGVFLVFAIPASAATVGYTEGRRDLVDGTMRIAGGDAAASGFMLGTIGRGAGEYSQIGIFGRIVGHADFFTFRATSDFRISFAFDGVSVAGEQLVSGFVRQGRRQNEADFVLRTLGDPAADQVRRLRTDISQAAGSGGSALIFSGEAGKTYSFGVDSRVARDKGAASYDIRISVVPLPESALLLLGGIAGLGYIARRKA
ncbi:VPLPA-CTERM sorting domain-containing protein [uncultured Roseobacter sp.]|uniref:VPLPA-CTERM sorting domain-containing protein n=1 Tax=uncultured Roseobacter sp. TaxID=114847 RepID=UPI00260985D8|nr:VPLPA-CTERM sorting domain-containing protein [uncultured Roseobacter sp.]